MSEKIALTCQNRPRIRKGMNLLAHFSNLEKHHLATLQLISEAKRAILHQYILTK